MVTIAMCMKILFLILSLLNNTWFRCSSIARLSSTIEVQQRVLKKGKQFCPDLVWFRMLPSLSAIYSPEFVELLLGRRASINEGLDLQARGQSTFEENLVTGTCHRT